MMGKRRSRDEHEAEEDGEAPVAAASHVGGMVDRVAQFGRRGRLAGGEADPLEDWVELPSYRPSFGALLVRAGMASDRDVKDALEEGLRTGERLGEVVIRRGWATEVRIAQLLAEQWQLPFREAGSVNVYPDALQRVPLAVARELRALPIGLDDTGVVLAIADPNEDLFAAVKSRIGDASYVVVARSVLDPLIEQPEFSLAHELASAETIDEAATHDNDDDEMSSYADAEPADAEPAEAESADAESADAEFADPESVHQWPSFEQPEPEYPGDADPAGFLGDIVEEPQSLAVDAWDEPVRAAPPIAEHYEPMDPPHSELQPWGTDGTEESQFGAGDFGGGDNVGGTGTFGGTGNIGDTDTVGAVIGSIDAAAAELNRARTEVNALGQTLTQARGQLLDYESRLATAAEGSERDGATIRSLESELAAAAASRERDEATIRRLEAELSQRNDLFDTLKGQIANLTTTLATSDSDRDRDEGAPTFD